MALVRLDCNPHLRAHTLVCAEQRQIAVGCAAGNDLDQTRLVKVLEAGDDIAAELLEVLERLAEEALPKAGGLRIVGLAGLHKESFIFPCSDDLA